MSKKAKANRKDSYKKFLDGMVVYREKFVNEKMQLVEKILSDESLKDEIMKKDRKEMSKLERAAVDTITSRDLQAPDQLEELSATIIEAQVRSAKFKYTPKSI